MLIALLVVLGVDLIVIVVLLAAIVGRRRWVQRQPGSFRGAIRVRDGEVDGLGSKWKRGSGHWVRDVLVWNAAPLMIRNVVLPVDRVSGERSAQPGEVKRLGDQPVVVELDCDGATIEIAARPEHRPQVVGPLSAPAGAG